MKKILNTIPGLAFGIADVFSDFTDSIIQLLPSPLRDIMLSFSKITQLTIFIIFILIITVLLTTIIYKFVYYFGNKYKNFVISHNKIETRMTNIHNYHLNYLSKIIGNDDVGYKSSDDLYLDFILADIQHALTLAYGHGKFQCSIFIPVKKDDGTKHLQMHHTTEIIMGSGRRLLDFEFGEGFCGIAAKEGKIVFDSKYKKIFGLKFRNRLYKEGIDEDDKISFMCIPIYIGLNNNKSDIIGVISIDSERHGDFYKADRCNRLFSDKIQGMGEIVGAHILQGRYARNV